MRLLVVLLLMMSTASGQPMLSQVQKVRRLPMQRKKVELKSPTSYAKWLLRIDPKTGEEIYHDPKPTVVLLGARSGKYALRWIGVDGKQKTIIMQRDGVISATVSRTASGEYLYVYTVHNLPSSGQRLGGVVVQTFASDVRAGFRNRFFHKDKLLVPVWEWEDRNIYIGLMTKTVEEFKKGDWIRFGILPDFKPAVTPGRSFQFRLLSSAPPGMVGSRIHGETLGVEGIGEPIPEELLALLPTYEDWPYGWTIGPVEELKGMGRVRRAEYIRERLGEFRRLGWMTADVVGWYERSLREGRFEEVLRRAEQDVRAGKITSEVYGMIRFLLGEG